MGGAERPVKMHFHQSRPHISTAFSVHKIINRFFYRFTNGTHSDDDMIRIIGSIIAEKPVIGPDFPINHFHIRLHQRRHGIIITVGSLPRLEENIRVLGGSHQFCPAGVQGMFPKLPDCLKVGHFLQIIIRPYIDFLHFVGGAETVKKMQERKFSFNSRQMGDRSKIHRLLYTAACQDSRPGLPTGINVRMIAEDGQGMSGDRPCRHMEHPGQQLPRHFIQIRNHKEQPLGSRKSRGKRPDRKRTMHGPCGPCFRLHFRDIDSLPEYILPPFRRPFIHIFGHGRRRRNRIHRRHIAISVSYMGSGLISVHCFLFPFHHKGFLLAMLVLAG